MSDSPIQARTRSTIFGAIVVLYGVSYLLESSVEALRYAKYGLPILALALAAPVAPTHLRPQPRWLGHALLLLASVLGTSLLAIFVLGHPGMRLAEETYFLFAPLLLARIAFAHLDPARSEDHVCVLVWFIAIGFVIEVRGGLIGALASPGALIRGFVTSNAATESGASFVFGLFVLYFLLTGRRRAALAVVPLLLLSFKRVAILGVVLVAIAYAVLRAFKIDLRRYPRLVPLLLVAINGVILLITYELAHGAFDEVIEAYTGLPANLVTMGRVRVYGVILSGGGITWFGHGLGHVTALLDTSGLTVLNAHSDILKYALELGPPLAAGLLYGFYRLCMRSTEMLLLMCYVNVLFISDNVSIYFDVMFIFYVLQGCLLARASDRSHA